MSGRIHFSDIDMIMPLRKYGMIKAGMGIFTEMGKPSKKIGVEGRFKQDK